MTPPTRFVGHSTVLMRLGGLTVVTDPVLGAFCSGLRRVVAPGPVPYVDLVVISHLHADHLDLPSLRRLDAPTVVVPRGAGPWLRSKKISGVLELGVGESTTVGDLTVTATDCRHDHRRWPVGDVTAHPLGYLLEDGDDRVYFAGDTDLFDGMSHLGDVDLALLPVWGWGPDLGPGHLDPARAAEAAALVRPAVAMPIHWGTFAPTGYAWRMRHQLTDPPHAMARVAADLAPTVTVAVTAPGQRLAR